MTSDSSPVDASEAGPGEAPSLRCLGGQPLSQNLVDDWAAYRQLSGKAQANLWDLLLPSLLGAPAPELEKRAQAYCNLYAVPPQQLQRALRTCSFLVSRASLLDLGAKAFREDLQVLANGDPKGLEILMSGYDGAKGQLRREMLKESILDHGKTLTGLDWRIDSVVSSHRGTQLQGQVAMMTFRYRENGREETITLQVTPEALKQIQASCEAIFRISSQAPGQ